jgi:LPXTG-motif cell wall-anchored protein
MAEPGTGRSATRTTAKDASRGSATRPGVLGALARASIADPTRQLTAAELAFLALALAAASALVASYFSTVVYVTTKTASCVDLATPAHAADCAKTGGDQHSIAFILLGVAVLGLALLFVARRMRLASLAIGVVGLVALLIALVGDVPQTGRTGVLSGDFTAGTAHAGSGLWLELVGGGLAIVAAAVALIWLRDDPARHPPDRATPSDAP